MALTQIRRLATISLALAVLATIGCSRGPEVFPINGKVTLDGAPIQDGTIMFLSSEGANEMAKGKIIEGAYSLDCTPGNKTVQIGGYTSENKIVPWQYLSQDSSLSANVTQEAELDFELTSKQKRRR
ncbi:hypothetical protein DTL21_22125 [Bremerella cremea]|uniref:Carboxypeptidase regulatory-like domain-containing protein n=1 Tax=Blastopirellula marina TaxID=124 RepID=A0A2S8FFF7_9BACT|nr:MULTISPECIES: hypothetical protein [Pirellulaceae]PQO30898.1 hypothetical protein C5Y83_22090 [Blastopirellula marina]RCS44045.1 hypothetical protein DTL21_22125 [Bremerella cremea]